jgi:hypothetical protein
LAASSFRTGCRQNVCYWHIANMHSQSADVRLRGKADITRTWSHVCFCSADIGRAFVRRAHRGRLRPPVRTQHISLRWRRVSGRLLPP